MTPSSSASRMVRSTRIGDIGWLGPKLYSVRLESKTTVAGPVHSTMCEATGGTLRRAGRHSLCETGRVLTFRSTQWWPA